jgi:hypothetical protein
MKQENQKTGLPTIDKMIDRINELKEKGDPILWNDKHWTKQYNWTRSTKRGILAVSDFDPRDRTCGIEVKYKPETGDFECPDEHLPGIGTSRGELITTVEKGLTDEQAFAIWQQLVKKGGA